MLNKNLYKIFLTILKYVPITLACCKIITLLLHFYNITTFPITFLGGTSLIFLILLYILSYIFQFCGTHRLALHYVTSVTVITIVDYYIKFPISTIFLYRGYLMLSGLFIVLWLLVWFTNRKNPKIDHIKQLCENYANCCK